MKISLCMIVRNEEEVLGRCLEHLPEVFDEIIIVDTGSTDKTKEIAAQFTNKIYDFAWVDDFSQARNYSFSLASGDYIMWLDADDVITSENLKKISALKPNLHRADCFFFKYVLMETASGTPTFEYYRERIVKNDKTFFWQDPVHEVITPHGKVEYCDISIHHKKVKQKENGRNLKIYENHLAKGNALTARQKFYYSRELFFNKRYPQAIENFEDYLNNFNGWKENCIDACLTLGKCYHLTAQPKNAIKWLVHSFCYDRPRAEILCDLANELITIGQFENAVYWLKLAKKCKINLQSGAFVLAECYDFIPNLLLCVCYYHLNDYKKAKYYNNLAKKINPLHPSVKFNEEFFEKLKHLKQN